MANKCSGTGTTTFGTPGITAVSAGTNSSNPQARIVINRRMSFFDNPGRYFSQEITDSAKDLLVETADSNESMPEE
jgi:hypothetical protein